MFASPVVGTFSNLMPWKAEPQNQPICGCRPLLLCGDYSSQLSSTLTSFCRLCQYETIPSFSRPRLISDLQLNALTPTFPLMVIPTRVNGQRHCVKRKYTMLPTRNASIQTPLQNESFNHGISNFSWLEWTM